MSPGCPLTTTDTCEEENIEKTMHRAEDNSLKNICSRCSRNYYKYIRTCLLDNTAVFFFIYDNDSGGGEEPGL